MNELYYGGTKDIVGKAGDVFSVWVWIVVAGSADGNPCNPSIYEGSSTYWHSGSVPPSTVILKTNINLFK